MPSKESRKEAIRQFKERKPFLGIFAVRCASTGKLWVGSSRNLYAVQNSTWFSLRLGGYYDPSLQQEWNAQGESAFTLEILETREPSPEIQIPGRFMLGLEDFQKGMIRKEGTFQQLLVKVKAETPVDRLWLYLPC